MSGYVYIIKSLRNGRYYIGSTENIDRRFSEHNLGKTPSTRYLRPWILAFKQQYPDIVVARKVEAKLKKFKSKIILEEIINSGNLKMNLVG